MASPVQCRSYRFGTFTLDLESGALLAADGTEIPLRPKSFALLRLLAENAGRLLSQEVIMEALWPNLFVTENNITQCIHDIRRALGAEAHQILRTRPRRGYLLNPVAVPPAGGDPAWPDRRLAKSPADESERRQCAPDDEEVLSQALPGSFLRPAFPAAGVMCHPDGPLVGHRPESADHALHETTEYFFADPLDIR